MKIDKSVIDSKAMELIDYIARSVWSDNNSKNALAADLGYINGVYELAKGLKMLLKEDGDGNDK